VWAVLDTLSDGHRYRELISITDDEHEVVQRIMEYTRSG
jgi:uncharacterized protein YlzI (FlbEa/FlbD family)